MRTHAVALCIFAGHLAFFSIINLFINPHPDMIDHWVWSQHLSLSYYEHPPMVALAFRLFTAFFGNSEFVLEFAAQFYNLSILGLCYAICFRFFGKQAAIFCLILLESTPYFFLGSAFLHIDQPFLIFWLINLYCFCRFLQTQSFKWLLWIGLVAGLGGLSKYITVLFYLGVFVHFLVHKEQRKNLWNPWLYLAGFLSLALLTPVFVWNFQNDWVSFRFQFTRGLSGAPLGQNLILFTLGHWFLFSAIWSSWSFVRHWKDRKIFAQSSHPESAILTLSLVPLAFFTLMSIRGSIADPHWANVAYLGLLMISAKKLAEYWESTGQAFVKKMLTAGVALNVLVVLGTMVIFQIPQFSEPQYQLKYTRGLEGHGFSAETIEKMEPLRRLSPTNKADFVAKAKSLIAPEIWKEHQVLLMRMALVTNTSPVNSLVAWQKSADQIQSLLQTIEVDSVDFIIAKEFQLSSAMSFYFPNFPLPHSIEKPERNQWSRVADVQGKPSIVLCKPQRCYRVAEWVKERFDQDISYLGGVQTKLDGKIVRNLDVFTMNIERNAK